MPSRPRGREEVCTSQSQRDSGCNLGPRDCVFHKTVSRLPVANHIFLGSWIVDNCQCHSLRSAPQTRHVAHLKQCYHGASVKLSGGTGLVHKNARPTWDSLHLPSEGPVAWAAWNLEGHKTHSRSGSVPLQSTQEPERLRPRECTKARAHVGQYPCRASRSLSSVDPGSTCCLGLWQTHCGPSTASTTHILAVFICSVPSSPQHN